jgi:hypothetical protein
MELGTLPSPVRNAPVAEGERRGGAGVCQACGGYIIDHFDPVLPRVFIGCPAATDNTVFSLVPIEATMPVDRPEQLERTGRRRATPRKGVQAVAPDAAGDAQGGPTPKRKFQVARHFLTRAARRRAKDIAKPGTAKEKVVQTLLKAPDGALARDIIEKTGLPHGSVQQALGWLRDHDYVDSRAITPAAAKA